MTTSRDEATGGRVICIEPFAGVSGDMFLGALLDLGADLDRVRRHLKALAIGGYELTARKCSKAGIEATKVEVLEDARNHHPHHHRTFRDIRHMISHSGLSRWVCDRATLAFERLAMAEGKIHHQEPDAVHFHEVGAVDSIVDIVGTIIAIEGFLPATTLCAPVNVGQGSLECQHGRYPVPGPATLELLKGVPIYSDALPGELTTPTGAALLAALVDRFDSRPLMKVRAVGYGAGTRDLPGAANVLRVSLGDEVWSGIASGGDGPVAVIETGIDDMNPQVFGSFFEKALGGGALDVYLTPIQMKKGRPGTQLTVMCRPEQIDDMARLMFAETTTLGLRYRLDMRKTLERRFETVCTEYGNVDVKVAVLDGRAVNFIPEFEGCRRLADEKGVPVKLVMAAATHAYLARTQSGDED